MDEEHKRMCWASRRGMLELDLILEPFVQQDFPALGALDRERYRALMSCQDQELFGWFLKRESPEDPELRAIIGTIIEALRRRGERLKSAAHSAAPDGSHSDRQREEGA